MKYIIFFLSALIMIACKNERMEIGERKVDTATPLVGTSPESPENTENKCEVVLEFLYEYEKNYDRIYEKDFINYEGDYSVNHENVAYFIKTAQFEKYATKRFIDEFRSLISDVDKRLTNNPQTDGTIDGLEADYVLRTQEIEEILDQIRDRKLSCESKSDGLVTISFSEVHQLDFSVRDGKIDKIGV